MDILEFSQNIPSDQLLNIFMNFFEQHMIAYELLRGINFVDFNVSEDSSSLLYSVKVMDDKEKEIIKNTLCNNVTITVYGDTYKPSIYLNGDLLCITFNK